MTDSPSKSFEDRFKELSAIVERFEHGEVSLAESLALFKDGMSLVSSLEKELKETEQTLEEIEKDFAKSTETQPTAESEN